MDNMFTPQEQQEASEIAIQAANNMRDRNISSLFVSEEEYYESLCRITTNVITSSNE